MRPPTLESWQPPARPRSAALTPSRAGKTHTIVSLLSVTLLSQPKSRVLLCAPTNIAMAEVAKRLLERRPAAVADADILVIVSAAKVAELDPALARFSLPTRAEAMMAEAEALSSQLLTCVECCDAVAASADAADAEESKRQCLRDAADLARLHVELGVSRGCSLQVFRQVTGLGGAGAGCGNDALDAT